MRRSRSLAGAGAAAVAGRLGSGVAALPLLPFPPLALHFGAVGGRVFGGNGLELSCRSSSLDQNSGSRLPVPSTPSSSPLQPTVFFFFS